MPQINLLKQTGNNVNLQQETPKILVWVFLAILVFLVGYYGYLFYQGQAYQNDANTEQAAINSKIQEANTVVDGRNELLVRQQQLQDLTKLIQGHIYWSQIFPKLAAATLARTNYTSMSVDSADGSIELNATVPTLEDLDKYMQVFDQPDVIKYFSNVRIGGFSKVQVQNTTQIQFQVKMDYNPSIVQYNNNN